MIHETPLIDSSLVNEIIDRIVQCIHPLRVILIGSRARGDAHSGSDYDLLVVVEKDVSKRAAIVALDTALIGLKLQRDIIVIHPLEYERDTSIPGTAARAASKEGVVLYER